MAEPTLSEAIAGVVREIAINRARRENDLAAEALRLTHVDYIGRLHWVETATTWQERAYLNSLPHPRAMACWIVPLDEQV